ncbi:MAG: hypothetical protein IPL36_11220 [Nigerium sp.]|nr:hypothetical protein [Nigerium sp.]
MAFATGKSGGRILQLVDLHGDLMGTLPVADGATGSATIGLLAFAANDEYGVPLDLNSGGVSANAPPRYGYLGGQQRSAETLGGTILMGSRVYQPAIGRFTSIDSEPGGNASEYDYVHSDPVHNTDITGNAPDWKAVLGKVAQVAEIGSIIPGPVGAAFGTVGAVAYAACGDSGNAARMGITAAANMVGAGLAVKATFKIATHAAKVGKAYQSTYKAARASKSFRASEPVARGLAAHKAWNTALRPLERIKGVRIDRSLGPGRGRPDAQVGKVAIELKPGTASGRKKGASQVRKYLASPRVSRGYLVLYPPKITQAWKWRVQRVK